METLVEAVAYCSNPLVQVVKVLLLLVGYLRCKAESVGGVRATHGCCNVGTTGSLCDLVGCSRVVYVELFELVDVIWLNE